MAARQDKINLLPESGLEGTTFGRVLAWILSTFRIIVIVTEIIVMIAFLSRFWLDAKNTDLSDQIEEKQAILSSSANFEKEFKATQRKLEIFSQVTANEKVTTSSLSTIVSLLPVDLFLNSVTFNDNSVSIEGKSPNEKSIQQLIVNLNSTGEFEKINLTDLKSDISNPNLFTFKLSAQLKN